MQDGRADEEHDRVGVCQRRPQGRHGASCEPPTVRSYLVTSGDLGHTLRVTVEASNAWGTRSATSRATAVIARPTAPSPIPGPVRVQFPPPPPVPVQLPAPPPVGSSSSPFGLFVSGDRLVNSAGQIVQLHGVNRSGHRIRVHPGRRDLRWRRPQRRRPDRLPDRGDGRRNGRVAHQRRPDRSQRGLLAGDQRLGHHQLGRGFGANYIDAIVGYVHLLHQYGIYAELSLVWAAPGDQQATYQNDAPDEDNSPAMWTSMAQTFKNDPNVILAPWGETTVDWSCFENGCDDEARWASDPGDGDGTCGNNCYLYTSAGMQQAATDMRAAGYHGPIAIPCIHYANDCSDSNGSWISSMPTDPDHQLLAEVHAYGGNPCDTTSCFDLTMLPILQAGHPLIFGETGETWNYSDCPSTFYIESFLQWAEQNGVGTEAWVWDTWGACSTGAMISNYDGTPEDAWAAYVQSNYQTMFPPDSQLPSPT